MFGVTVGGDLPEILRDARARPRSTSTARSQWEAELVTLRAGGLVPIARQYPGAREFVEAYRKEFPGADLSYQTAAGLRRLPAPARRRAARRRRSTAKRYGTRFCEFDTHTAFGAFKVDPDGLQIGAQDAAVPVAGRQEGDRLARGTRARQARVSRRRPGASASDRSDGRTQSRRWIAFLATVLVVVQAAFAGEQVASRPYRIGVLNEAFAANHPTVEGLKSGLRELGFEEGRDVVFDIRFTQGRSRSRYRPRPRLS